MNSIVKQLSLYEDGDPVDIVDMVDAVEHIGDLTEALQLAFEYIASYVDVVDGPDGQFAPNRAMVLVSIIGPLLEGSADADARKD